MCQLQICQVQIFVSLLSSMVLKYDVATLANASNIDILLTFMLAFPIALAVVMESPLKKYMINSERRAALWKALAHLYRKYRPSGRSPVTILPAELSKLVGHPSDKVIVGLGSHAVSVGNCGPRRRALSPNLRHVLEVE